MENSTVLARFAGLAYFGAAASFVMMFVSAVGYLFTDKWLVMTGANWFFLSVFMLAGGIAFSIAASQFRKSEARAASEAAEREREEDRQRRAAEDYAKSQEDLLATVTRSNQSASQALDRLPVHLEEAANLLGQAEVDWEERVYNPFWASVEGCAVKLTDFEKDVELIHSLARQYQSAASAYDRPVPPFVVSSVSVDAMDAYKKIYDTLAKNTRRALGDIEFASIYENWHGNRIMAAGFSDLRTAVNQMSINISSRISSLNASLGSMSQEIGSLAGAVNNQSAVLRGHVSAAASQNAELVRVAKQSVSHEKDIANRLWNIEHGHKPMV
ncbi:hypothetical protein LCL87_02245 [Rhodococcus hoagii]|nr:hypothetical protein [Prescottella equi]